MLIHIESYIRQLLPPNWRTPDCVGLARVLFEPIRQVLDRHNDFEREAIFRAGLTGQKLLLQYYLQNTIDGGIYLRDADGVRVDFTVMVPASLSAEQRKQVTDIVDTYKLAGKRYELRSSSSITSTYTFRILAVEKIPNDSNGAWRIRLSESLRGIRTFTIQWYKGASNTPISTYLVEDLNTNVVDYLYFNPKSEDPWHIVSNGAGNYRTKVSVTLSAILYSDEETVVFTNSDLGIDDGGGVIVVPPVENNSNIEAIVDHQNTTLRIKLVGGSGNYNAVVKLGTQTMHSLGMVAYGSTYLELSFATYSTTTDLRGNTLTIALTQGATTTQVDYFLPKLVLREYTPDYINSSDDRTLMLRLTKGFGGEYRMVDFGENRGYAPEYFIDGGNGGDCDILPNVAYPVEKRVEVLKVLVPTSGERWQIGGNYFIAENVFWIQMRPWSSMGVNTKGLWQTSEAIGKPRMLADAAAFTLPATKKYNRAFSGKLEGVSDAELDRVSWSHTNADLPLWLYSGQIIAIMNGMGVTQGEGGVHTWTLGGARIVQFAEAMLSALGVKRIVITDWEGEETEEPENSWRWSNTSSGAAAVKWLQDYLTVRGKEYYDWFQNTGLSYNDKSYSLISQGGTFSYVAYRPSNSQQYFHTAEDWVNLWANFGSVTLPTVDSGRVGLGYNNVTKYIETSYAKPSKRRYHAVPHVLFAQMVCNWYSLKQPGAKLISIQWPTEDQDDRRSVTTHRFKPSLSMQGYVRGRDIRYVYSQNLYEDFVLYMYLSRNVHLQHVWSTNDNVDPYSALYYASKNGQQHCAIEPWVYNYEGTDSYACPSSPVSYIGMEGQIYEALISMGEIYAQRYKNICDGINNQLDLNNAFEYRRGGQGFWVSVAASVGDEQLRAWKYDQPYLTIWRNTQTNQRVIFFQDLFNAPFQDCEFRFTVNGVQYTRTAKGNRAYHEAIGVALTQPTVADFNFITNTTGYFDSDDFVDKITALAGSSRVVRWCVRWDEYETSPGVYATSKLASRKAQVDAIYAAQNLDPPIYAIDFWGVRHSSDIESFIPADDVVMFQNGIRAVGDLIGNGSYGLGSFSSTAYRTRVANCATSITNWFNTNASGRLYYVSISTGQTEEFFNYLLDTPNTSSNYDSHGDFCATALASWRTYLLALYGSTTPWGESSATATLPTAEWATYGQPWVVSMMIQTPKGKAWAQWTSTQMEATVVAFKNAVKAANPEVNVIHFIADYFRDQSNGWYMSSPSTYPIVSQLDGLYHSDGDMQDDNDFAKKYSSFDSMVPTWGGNKLYFCEMDYKDMYMVGSGLPDPDAIKRVARAVYRKGGAGVHYAMSITSAQGAVINAANLEILAEIEAGTLARLSRSGAPTFQFNLLPMVYGGNSQLLDAYKNSYGGTETNVVNIELINNQ